MTWAQDPDGCIRRVGALIWLGMSLAFFLEIGGLIGWMLNQVGCGLALGMLLFALFWLWVWRSRPNDRDG